jgi:hypothetical protein
MHTSSTLDKVTSDLFPKGCAILISPDRCICCYEGVRCSKLHVFVNLEVGLASATALLGASDKPLVLGKKIIHDAGAPSSSSFVSRQNEKNDKKARQQQPQQERKYKQQIDEDPHTVRRREIRARKSAPEFWRSWELSSKPVRKGQIKWSRISL